MAIDKYSLELSSGRRLDLQPIRDTSEVEWAWAAGIYEGEGSIHGKTRSIQIRIPQKNPHILHKLRQFTGGSIRPHVSNMWLLNIGGILARRFIRHTWGWLSPHRQDQISKFCPLEEC